MVQSEVRAIRERFSALVQSYPETPVGSRQLGESLRIGSIQVESHQVVGYSPDNPADAAGDRFAEGHATCPRIVPAPGHCCAAVIVPQMPDGRLGLVVRYRFAPAKWSLEFPSALACDVDETWRDTCVRVLDEATGWAAREIKLLGSIQVDPSCMATHTIVCLAQSCTRRRITNWSADSMIAGCVAVTPAALDQLICSGDVEGSATLSALLLARLYASEASCNLPKSQIPCRA